MAADAIDPPAGPSAHQEIAGNALRGSIWTIGGYASAQFIRLLGNLVLTRLLFPEVFGQMALVNVFMQGLQMFSDVGTGPAIIQNAHGDDTAFLDTAWTIQSVRGVLLWLGSWAIAAPAASFFAQPILRWLVPAAGFSAVLGGLESTAMHSVLRHLRLERLTVIEVGSQVVGIAASIGGALVDRAYFGADHAGAAWAFVAGNLLAGVLRVVLSHTALPGHRQRFRIDRQAAGAMVQFGRWVFVSTVLTFFAGQSDRLVFGKMTPIALLGIYGIAANLAMLPTLAVLKIGSSVAFPAYSRLASLGDLPRFLGQVRLPLLLGGGAIASVLLAGGPGLIHLLYDRRYDQAGWILQFLAAGAWFQIMEATNGAALLAVGRVPWLAAGSAAKVVGLLLFLPLGYRLGGFGGALAGLVASDVLKYLVSAVGLSVAGMTGYRLDLGVTLLVAATSAAGYGAWSVVVTHERPNLVGLAAVAVISVATWGTAGLRVLRRIGRWREGQAAVLASRAG